MQSIKPNPQRVFIANVLSEATAATHALTNVRVMGICVSFEEVYGNIYGKATTWNNLVLDDGTSLIDVLFLKPTDGSDVSLYNVGDNLDVVGSFGTICLSSGLDTSPCIFANTISKNDNPNANTLRFLEVVRSKDRTQPYSILALQTGIYMSDHMIELMTPFRAATDLDVGPETEPSNNQQVQKITIDPSQTHDLIKCSGSQGLTETQLASLLGCYHPDQCQALKQLLTEMQLAFQIYQNREDAYICL
jgi:hypothetical protein